MFTSATYWIFGSRATTPWRTVAGVLFVYRTHYEGAGPADPDVSVLDWFRRGWDCDDPWDWIGAELGGHVYGFGSIFEAARTNGQPPPQTVGELGTLLGAHR
jgi:hypothetical protein